MQRRPKNSCGVVGFQCKKVNTLLKSFKNLELQKVTYLASSDKLLQTIQTQYKTLLSGTLPEQSKPDTTQLWLKKDTISKCYNNFLNLPRLVQGVVHKTDVTDLSQITTKLLSGYCSDNLSILSFKDTIQQEQMYSRSFTDLYKSIKDYVQNNFKQNKQLDTVILKVVSDQIYVQNQQSGLSGIKCKRFDQPYNNIVYNQQQDAPYVYKQHKPGVLIPRSQPQKLDFSSVSFVAAPSYVVNSIQNISSLGQLINALKNWQGCSGPGVFFRQAQGQEPTFICLSQCL